jgi:hypothetical protein
MWREPAICGYGLSNGLVGSGRWEARAGLAWAALPHAEASGRAAARAGVRSADRETDRAAVEGVRRW